MEFKCDFITIFYECCIKISWQFKNLGNCLPGICEREPLAGHHAPEDIDDSRAEDPSGKIKFTPLTTTEKKMNQSNLT